MPQWTLFEQDFRAIDQVLSHLLEKTSALSVHLVDRSGQLITTAGLVGNLDVTGFAGLVAADFTANAELSSLLGDSNVNAVVNEGKSRPDRRPISIQGPLRDEPDGVEAPEGHG